MIPTDVRGLTFSRTPQMNINIVTLGAKDGKGCVGPSRSHGCGQDPQWLRWGSPVDSLFAVHVLIVRSQRCLRLAMDHCRSMMP